MVGSILSWSLCDKRSLLHPPPPSLYIQIPVVVGEYLEVEVAEGDVISWQLARVASLLPDGRFEAIIAEDEGFVER